MVVVDMKDKVNESDSSRISKNQLSLENIKNLAKFKNI